LSSSIEPLIEDLGQINLEGMHWITAGGESGPGSRPIAPEWVRSIRAQCVPTDVAFFFKQWGGVQKSKTDRLLDGRTYNAFPKHSRRVNLQSLPAPTQGVRRPDASKFSQQAV
jgi:protein gp37